MDRTEDRRGERRGRDGFPGRSAKGGGKAPECRGRRDARQFKPSQSSVAQEILAILPSIGRAMTKSDFAAMASDFRRIAHAAMPLGLDSIDGILDFDARTHLLTALLRAGRTSPSQDEAAEKQRKDMLAAVGETWLALGNADKAEDVMEAAGRPEMAILSLERSGKWEEAAEKALAAGCVKQAAHILDAHGEKAKALALYVQSRSDAPNALRLAIELKDAEAAKSIARDMDFKEAKGRLIHGGLAQAAMELAAESGNWREVASLYAQAGQYADAARALEKAGDVHRAIEGYRRAGMVQDAERLTRSAAEERLSKGDVAGAGEILRRHGMVAEAVELVRESSPETAFSWLQHSGQRDRARAFAAEMAGRLSDKGDRGAVAAWLSRSGQHDRAAAIWMELGNLEEALKSLEAQGAWSKALAVAVQLGRWPKIQSVCAKGKLPIPEEAKAGRKHGKKKRVPSSTAPSLAEAAPSDSAAPMDVPHGASDDALADAAGGSPDGMTASSQGATDAAEACLSIARNEAIPAASGEVSPAAGAPSSESPAESPADGSSNDAADAGSSNTPEANDGREGKDA